MVYKRKEVIGKATLYLGDCMDVMPTLGKVDAVVTDPPYGIGYVHSGKGGCLAQPTKFGGKKIIGDDTPFDPSFLLSKKPTILWGANHFADKLPSSPFWMVWDKRDGVCSNDQADCEIAWCNIKKPSRVFRHLWNGMLKQSEKGVSRVHPTQKPIALMKWCISHLPKEINTILDPFMGSGTTGVAAVQMGREFIGIELDEDYYNIAVERIKKAQDQGDLFIK